jgi:hypothetical protein
MCGERGREREREGRLSIRLWSSCILTPLRSLTGLVGQLFASYLEGSGSCPGDHPHFWNWDLLLAMSRYIGDPDVIPDLRPR